jgi:hypothetical protein
MNATCSAHRILLGSTILIKSCEQCKLDSHCAFSPTSSHIIPLMYKYSSKHPVLKHNLWFSLNAKKQVSHLYKTTDKNYSLLYLNIYVYRWHKRRRKILNCTVPNIPGIQSALSFVVNTILNYYHDSQMFDLCQAF